MQDVASTSVVPQQKSELAQRVLKGAWVGVLLGLLLEALLLVVALWQDRLPDRVHIVAETVQKLSWSALVCAALVAGQAAVRAGTSIAGLIGLFAAPVAILTARALHKATLEVLGANTVTATQWFAASIKGVEYALLSLAITWLVKRGAAWKLYVIAGALVGMATYVLTSLALSLPGDPLQRALVEVSHPIGCALAVRFSSQVNARLRD
jgi:hypothetical protein